MWSVTLSTAAWAPKVLLRPSMTICALAPGSSHGVSARGFDWVAIMACVAPSEVRRRRRAPPLWRVERPLDHACPLHAPLPRELAVQIDFRPDRGTRRHVRGVHHRERQIAFAGRRPGRGRYAAHLLAARALRVQQRVVRSLVSLDIESYELPRGPAPLLREQRAAPGEVTLAEVDQPGEPQLERRAVGADAQRMRGGATAGPAPRRANCPPPGSRSGGWRGCAPPPSARPTRFPHPPAASTART